MLDRCRGKQKLESKSGIKARSFVSRLHDPQAKMFGGLREIVRDFVTSRRFSLLPTLSRPDGNKGICRVPFYIADAAYELIHRSDTTPYSSFLYLEAREGLSVLGG